MPRWSNVVSLVACIVLAGTPALAGPETKEIAAVIDAQFAGFRDPSRASVYTKTAMVAMTGGTSSPQVNKLDHNEGRWSIFGLAKVGKHKVRDLRVVVARDGNSAWASFVANVTVLGIGQTSTQDYRATELLARTPSGWQVHAAAWSLGVANATLARAAQAGKLAPLDTVFDQNLGDQDVIAALRSLAASGLDATAGARADVLGIGTAPGDTTLGGKKLAAKLKAEWTDKLALDGSTWATTTGVTACATANVRLTRGDATVPARLFAVFEKDGAGAWSPVLVHLAAAAP